VVIGGGSAGATVAARLSEVPRFSVLLLEAGLDEPTGTQIPSFFFNFIGSDIDWQYTTESEDEACLNKEHRKCYWPRGKVRATSNDDDVRYVTKKICDMIS
jgi:choline dehydrogenase